MHPDDVARALEDMARAVREHAAGARPIEVASDVEASGADARPGILSQDAFVAGHVLYVTLQTTGVERAGLNVEVANDRLVRLAMTNDAGTTRHDIPVGWPVVPDAVEANYRNGVVDLVMPLREGKLLGPEVGA